jgi:hypothetical protein
MVTVFAGRKDAERSGAETQRAVWPQFSRQGLMSMLDVSNRASLLSGLLGISRGTCRLGLVLLAAVLTAPEAVAETPYCGVKVLVSDASRLPVHDASVVLLTNDGVALEQTATDERGVASFCDVPLSGANVAVALAGCSTILVRDVRPDWPRTREVAVTYTPDLCTAWTVRLLARCLLLIRVRDPSGSPVIGAQVTLDGSADPRRLVTDSLGRAFTKLLRGSPTEGTVSADGRLPAKVSGECPIVNGDVEAVVTLRSE